MARGSQSSAPAKEATGDMVLFLRRDPTDAANPWRPASIFKEWPTSVAWLDGDTVSAVEQFINPGPAEVLPLEYVKSRKAFRALVAYYGVEAARDAVRPGGRVPHLPDGGAGETGAGGPRPDEEPAGGGLGQGDSEPVGPLRPGAQRG
jgi:hypothetical protein